MKRAKCRWNCGRETSNRSVICDYCWAAAEERRERTNEGYQAWVEWKLARQPKQSKPRTASQQAHLDSLKATRMVKLAKEMPQTGG
jgi:hypothetical protein